MAVVGSEADVREEAGSVIIEFAFTLPILLLVMMGMVDFGFALREKLLATSAAREGARMAVLPGYSDAQVKSYTEDYLSDRDVTGTAVVGGDPPVAGRPYALKRVTVSIQHEYLFLRPIALMFGDGFVTTTVVESAVMRSEIHAVVVP
jgi:TadE-like protein